MNLDSGSGHTRRFRPPGEPSWTVLPMQQEHITEVAALAADEPTAPHWPLLEYSRMLKVIAATPSRRGAWVVVEDAGGAIDGFCMASHVAGICDLEAVVVRASRRGRGLGAALVNAAAGWGTMLAATRLELEVRASNSPALRLYQRTGFTLDGTRVGYYRNPDEDAVLMSLRLR